MSESSAAVTSGTRSCAVTSGGAAGTPVIGPVRESGAIWGVTCDLAATDGTTPVAPTGGAEAGDSWRNFRSLATSFAASARVSWAPDEKRSPAGWGRDD